MLRQGKSFSGHERNCVFLNSGEGTFANVSAVSGFDLEDDCRGIAQVDWDFDGRPDYWVTNRSGPNLRLMRNNVETQNHFLAIRLTGNGTTTNRDAVGARVELHLANDDSHRRVKSARAGSGFLSQSSQWLHFGLGSADEVSHIVVHWPGGDSQMIHGLQVDSWYDVDQNQAVAQLWNPPEVDVPDAPPHLEEGTSRGKRTLVSVPLPLPEMLFQTFKGQAVDLGAANNSDQCTLAVLWATWCPICLEELTELGGDPNALEQANVRVLALSVDGLGDRRGASPEETVLSFARLDVPFAGGMATEDIIAQLHLLDEFVHNRVTSLAVPISILISPQGQLAAIYEGPVSPIQVLSDVATIKQPSADRLAQSLPFPGRWLNRPDRIDIAILGDMFMESQRPADAEHYFHFAYESGDGESQIAAAHALADCLGAQNRLPEAAALLEEAMRTHPGDATLRTSLSGLLIELDQPAKAQSLLQEAINLQPNDGPLRALLGSALLAQRQYEPALEAYEMAIRLDDRNVEAYLGAAQAALHLGNKQTAYATLESLCHKFPEDAALRATIATGFADNHDHERATYYFQESLARDDQNGQTHFELARCLDRLGDHQGADEHYQRAAELSPDQPVALNQYGIVLARRQQYDEAIRYFRNALELNPEYTSAEDNLRRAQEMRQQKRR